MSAFAAEMAVELTFGEVMVVLLTFAGWMVVVMIAVALVTFVGSVG